MASRRSPLTELPQARQTPTRYAPSTPHAIRAFQQRSGAKQQQRSIRALRNLQADEARPESARGILRRLAKITAPATKRALTPASTALEDKENRNVGHDEEQQDEDDEDRELLKKPNLTLAVEDSVDDEDSELPTAPTPSVLPDDDDYDQPTITFKSIDLARNNRSASERIDRRRSSRPYVLADEGVETGPDDGDTTIMTERGRRAISEEPTGRLSRYSFGSIRMSDFGPVPEVRRSSGDLGKTMELERETYGRFDDDEPLDLGGETEDLARLRRSPSQAMTEDPSIHVLGLGEDPFLSLHEPEQALDPTTSAMAQTSAPLRAGWDAETRPDAHAAAESGDDAASRLDLDQPAPARRQTLLEKASTAAQKARRKRLKLTRHGTTVPALPSSIIRRIAVETQKKLGKRKTTLGRDHMKALEQATEWYFEQVGADLETYSNHGGHRTRVVCKDVLMLMKRQRVLTGSGELRQMAEEWLPKDILEELDMPETV